MLKLQLRAIGSEIIFNEYQHVGLCNLSMKEEMWDQLMSSICRTDPETKKNKKKQESANKISSRQHRGVQQMQYCVSTMLFPPVVRSRLVTISSAPDWINHHQFQIRKLWAPSVHHFDQTHFFSPV